MAGASLNDNERAVDAGAAYVFRHVGSAWLLEATLIAPELADPLFEENFLEAQFGTDVACWRSPTLSKMGDLVVAGAPLHDLCGLDTSSGWGCLCDFGQDGGNGFNNGAAYVFQRINDLNTPQLVWDDGFMLVPLGCQAPSLFGRAVDIEDTRVVFTSILQNVSYPTITSRAHLYERTGPGNLWSEKLTLYPVAVESSHDFGNSIALSDGTVIVGAHIDGATSEGRSYVYNGMNDCDGNGVIDALDICADSTLDCNGNWNIDTCGEVFGCIGDIVPASSGCPGGTGNGNVNIDDLVALLNLFGNCPAPCPADLVPPGGNGVVNIDDLVAVLNAFGPCTGGSSSGATGMLQVVKMDFSSGWVDASGALADPASNGLISNAWTTFDMNWDVYRLFAQVADPNSTVTYAGGGLNSGPGGMPEPLVLNPGKGGQFFIPIAGSYAPPNVALFSMTGNPNFQLAAFGTYLTFGMAGGSPPVAMGNVTSLDGLLSGFVNAADAGWGVYGAVAGQGVVSDGNGGWRVMIGQFAVPKGKVFTAAVRLAGDGIDVYATVNSGVTTLP